MTERIDGKERASAAGPPLRAAWAGYAACAWALAFAAAHYYWAFGGAWLVGESGVERGRAVSAAARERPVVLLDELDGTRHGVRRRGSVPAGSGPLAG